MTLPADSRADADGAGPAPEHLRRVRSFVRREGRLTTAQAQALTELSPRYALSLQQAPRVVDCFGRVAPLVLEIGFGNGEALLWRAQQDPARNYLGIEVHRPGVGALMHRAAESGVDTIRVHSDDAVAFVDAMPEACLDEIIIEFPDPWPKKRHHKRRIVQPAFINALARRLILGGTLRLATDWQDYAEHMLDVLGGEVLLRNTAGTGYAPRHAQRPPTRFENRGVRRGHEIFDLEFRRV